ncbi:hypothetical protein TWF730_002216 [Orbilia blumenaviensis]|uniref:Triacylglycerol lipase n=1 Tax=Orbilia blumenaviensis TaxID=1796055 RepID=A0AAV9UET0_9PEZI
MQLKFEFWLLPDKLKARLVKMRYHSGSLPHRLLQFRHLHTYGRRLQGYDPRIKAIGKIIEDDFVTLREQYNTPKNPMVLSHGLFGFDTLQLLPWSFVPPLRYWKGINEALRANGCQVIVTTGIISFGLPSSVYEISALISFLRSTTFCFN